MKTYMSIIVISMLVLSSLASLAVISVQPAYASPKSLYFVPEHHTSTFQAWNINPDGTATYQATYIFTHSTDPSGIAMDEDSNTIFVSSEFSGGVEMVDATTMTSLGVSTGPSNLAGLAVDDANDIVYAVRRNTDDLYAYDWDPIAGTLTLKAGYPINLPGCSKAFGISLDETTGILWVADSGAGVARAYDTNTWTEDTSMSFTPSHKPIDITIDRLRRYVYTVSMRSGASVPSGAGSNIISQFDLATRTEATHNIGHEGVGIAVDEVTGYVYVTGGPGISPTTGPVDNLEILNPLTTPWTQIQETSDLGNPAGICIPQTEVAYNPLKLDKVDDIPVSVNPGQDITYTISYDNTGNAYDVHNVIITDNLPAEVSFVSATGGGTYDAGTHTVAWNLGTLTAGAPSASVNLEVTVDPGVTPGSTITNYATIDSDETPPTTVYETTDVSAAIMATVCSVWTTDSAGNPKVQFNITETVYLHWNANGNIDMTVYAPDGVTVEQQWLGLGMSGVNSFTPTHGTGIYTIDATGASSLTVAVGTFLVIPELPIGTAVALITMLGSLALYRRRKTEI